MNVQADFYDCMSKNGLTPIHAIPADGLLHRFQIEGDKRGSKNGWAILHGDDYPIGIFGSWKQGNSVTWCVDSKEKQSPMEQAKQKRVIAQLQAKRKRDIETQHKQAADKAARIWDHASQDFCHHPYLTKKRIGKQSMRLSKGHLVLPIVDVSGELTSLQFISANGDKRMLAGGKKKGCFIPVHAPKRAKLIVICEGWATGVSLLSPYFTEYVIAAIDAGNLLPVAKGLRKANPIADIIIAADADKIGLQKATEAAKAVNAELIKPEFPEGIKGTDFNDLACALEGWE